MHQILFSLLLILLPTQLGYHFWPEWAMVLGRRVDYLSPTLYLTDILIFLIILSWYISVRPRIIHKTPVIIPLILFALLNIFFAAAPAVAIYTWIKVFEFGLLGLYIANTKQTLKSTIFPLSIGIMYSSVIAIAQFMLQHTIGGPLWLLGERTFSNQTPGIAQFYFHQLWLRAYATFPHPNVLGGYLAVLLPLIYVSMPRHVNASAYKKHHTFFLATFIVGIAALIVTFSRSALLAFLLGMAIQKKKLLLPIILCAVLVISTISIIDESVVVRSQLNNSALHMFSQSPLVGIGLGNFLTQLPDYLVSRQIYFLQPVHNIYLLALAETGLIGFSLFGFIIWKALKNKHRIIHYSLLTILFLGLVDHYPLTLQQGQLLLTFLLALCMIQLPHADT